MITLTDLVNNIEIGIQSKGYEEFTGDNLIINIGVIGRCTNTSTTKYKVEINAIIEAMASKGIQFIAQSPHRGSITLQNTAIRKLEQLSIKDWKYIKPFLQDYCYLALQAGCFYDEGIIDKLFIKLPDELGKEIYDRFKRTEIVPAYRKETSD